MSEDSPLIGEELYYKFEDLLEEEDDRQERMYAYGYDFYPNFFKVLSEAYKTELEDIIFESLTEYEIPFTVFEIAKFIKLNYFYDFIFNSLIQRGIKYDLAFKIIKSYGLKIYFKNEYGTG